MMKYPISMLLVLLTSLPLSQAVADSAVDTAPAAPTQEVDISTKGDVSIPSDLRGQGVYVQFTFSDTMTKEVRKYLASRGYNVVDDKKTAAAVINVSGELYVKGKGGVDLGQYIESNGSAEFKARAYSNTSNKVDDGTIYQGAKLTGSTAGGVMVSVLAGVIADATGLTRTINEAWNESAEPNKNVKVKVFAWRRSDNQRQIFDVMAATNNVDYDTGKLINTAFSRALEHLN
jgi:hypothetical protein